MTASREVPGTRRRFSWRTLLDAVTSVVLISAASTVIWAHWSNGRDIQRPEPSLPSEPVSIDSAALKGSATAQVVLIEYSDFQCPFCGMFARERLPELERDYISTGRVQLAYRHLPLPSHQHAAGAARAAECAGAQGQFWAMHDRLFTSGAQLDPIGLEAHAAALPLKQSLYSSCLASAVPADAVGRDQDEAKGLGLTNTPAFLLGVRLKDGRVAVSKAFYGALPIEEFRSEIDSLLRRER